MIVSFDPWFVFDLWPMTVYIGPIGRHSVYKRLSVPKDVHFHPFTVLSEVQSLDRLLSTNLLKPKPFSKTEGEFYPKISIWPWHSFDQNQTENHIEPESFGNISNLIDFEAFCLNGSY